MKRSAEGDRNAQWFIVPPTDGPISGGTLYNRKLIGALQREGVPSDALDLQGARSELRQGRPGFYWLDTLYLEEARELRSLAAAPRSLGLLAHYLPSLVRCGALLSASDLRADEVLALGEVDAFLTPSLFMKTILGRLAGTARPILVVEPGSIAQRAERVPSAEGGVRAVLVANLVPGKGIAPFLRSLAAAISVGDPLQLTILGGSTLDPEYARDCRRLIDERPELRDRVVYEGRVSPDEVQERMSESNLLISASVMESYGMALAEARTIGIPILARDGGNVAAHVRTEYGGELVSDERDLAGACVRLCREPREHAARLARAHASAVSPRSWGRAAQDFIEQVEGLSCSQPLGRSSTE